MFVAGCHCLLPLMAVLVTAATSLQQSSLLIRSGNRRFWLNVVVTPKSPLSVTGYQQQDFTPSDKKFPWTITSFKDVEGRRTPIVVALVADVVNAGHLDVAYDREQIDKFVRAEVGHLACPTTVAVLKDSGIQIQGPYSAHGNALGASLDRYTVGLPDIRRYPGFYGAVERFRLSIKGPRELVTREAPRPGR
jgi:hypothetical protein